MNHLFYPLPTITLTHRHKTLDLSTPHVMGILNVTPDSSSDGGCYNTLENAVARAAQMIHEGATIIDIGAESTRPNAKPVDKSTEMARLSDIVSAIAKQYPDVWLSIDTSNPEVMKYAHALGADIWNDVRGLTRPNACATAANLDCPVVIMHSRGEPDTMDALTNYPRGIFEIQDELTQRIDDAAAAGVKAHNIIIDVGMGFAKDFEMHTALLNHLHEFVRMGYPMLFGVSRKRFLGEILNTLNHATKHTAYERDNIGVSAALIAVMQGASIIRTHNVGATKEALALYCALNQNQTIK